MINKILTNLKYTLTQFRGGNIDSLINDFKGRYNEEELTSLVKLDEKLEFSSDELLKFSDIVVLRNIIVLYNNKSFLRVDNKLIEGDISSFGIDKDRYDDILTILSAYDNNVNISQENLKLVKDIANSLAIADFQSDIAIVYNLAVLFNAVGLYMLSTSLFAMLLVKEVVENER